MYPNDSTQSNYSSLLNNPNGAYNLSIMRLRNTLNNINENYTLSIRRLRNASHHQNYDRNTNRYTRHNAATNINTRTASSHYEQSDNDPINETLNFINNRRNLNSRTASIVLSERNYLSLSPNNHLLAIDNNIIPIEPIPNTIITPSETTRQANTNNINNSNRVFFETTCPICLDKFNVDQTEDDSVALLKKCGHLFHIKCLRAASQAENDISYLDCAQCRHPYSLNPNHNEVIEITYNHNCQTCEQPLNDEHQSTIRVKNNKLYHDRCLPNAELDETNNIDLSEDDQELDEDEIIRQLNELSAQQTAQLNSELSNSEPLDNIDISEDDQELGEDEIIRQLNELLVQQRVILNS